MHTYQHEYSLYKAFREAAKTVFFSGPTTKWGRGKVGGHLTFQILTKICCRYK